MRGAVGIEKGVAVQLVLGIKDGADGEEVSKLTGRVSECSRKPKSYLFYLFFRSCLLCWNWEAEKSAMLLLIKSQKEKKLQSNSLFRYV